MHQIPDVTIGTLYSSGHEVLRKHYGTILGATLLLLLINIAAGAIASLIDSVLLGPDAIIQPVGMLTQVFLLGPIAVGVNMSRCADSETDPATWAC